MLCLNNYLSSALHPTKTHSNRRYGEHSTSSPPRPTNGLTTVATACYGPGNTAKPTNAYAPPVTQMNATTIAAATTLSTKCHTHQPHNHARGASQKPSGTPPNQKFPIPHNK